MMRQLLSSLAPFMFCSIILKPFVTLARITMHSFLLTAHHLATRDTVIQWNNTKVIHSSSI
jgi:hypothetical protein